MEYKLFDDYITLQALFKELSIIHSGGAIKGFLANNTVLFNGEDEKRRGKNFVMEILSQSHLKNFKLLSWLLHRLKLKNINNRLLKKLVLQPL